MALAAVKPAAPKTASTWISANAGSGKTRALVERVVTLLLLGVTPERICCITYTKAAAGEMRERILKALRELLVMDDAACRERVRALTGGEDIALARSLFARVLDSPFGGLQLTTIHGFCQQLLRQFPLEARLSPQFTVLEEVESETLQRIARQRLFEQAEQNKELAAALALIAERGGEHGFNELLRAAAKQGVWWSGLRASHPLELKEAIYASHGLDPAQSEEGVRNQCCDCLIPAEAETALRAALPQMQGATDSAFQPVLARWLEATERDARFAMLDAFYPLFFKPSDGLPRARFFTQKMPEQELLAAIAERYLAMVERCRALACAEESYASAQVAFAFDAAYRAIKAEYQALDYDDLIERTEALLRDHGGWVMTKLDHRIDHLLVDEAQDTSPGQWRIVRTLVEELIVTGGGVGSGGVPRSLLVVGDEKQSIFSFQGADPKQFAREAGGFAQLLEQSGVAFDRIALENSYRSAQAVLTLVDAVSALPAVTRALSAAGIPNRHYMKRSDQPVGRVVLHPPMAKADKAALPPFAIPTDYAITESTAQQLAHRMADEIGGWLNAGRCRAGDILILLWRRQPYADCLIRALEAKAIPVAGIDRLKLSEHLAVRDVMALMQWCGYPNDDLALAHVLRSPIVGVGEQALEDLAFGRTGSLWQRVQADSAHAALLERLLKAKHQSPYDFLTTLLEVEGARMRFAGRFGEEVHEVLDELKAQAASMPRAMAATITAFADWITRSEREVKRQQETQSDAVRIMTVHGAKGLEAPIVLLVNPTKNPDTGRETCLKADGLPVIAFSEDGRQAGAYRAAKDALKNDLFDEYYRLLYVALTRPRDELHLFAADPVREGSWYQLVAQAMAQLPTVKESERLVLQDPGTPKQPTASQAASAMPALPEWAQLAAAAPTPRQRVYSPSRLMEPALSPAMGGKAGASQRGVRIHRVLQFLTAQSDAAHIDRLLGLAAADWDDAARAQAAEEIAALHRAERWLWEQPGHAEVSIGGSVDGRIYSGQIDRLVITPDEAIIVDYKTGNHVPADAASAPEGYRLQLKIYHALLASLYPQKKIRSALLWTSGPQLMWMDEAVEATRLPS